MPIFDDILAQPAILISMGLALLLIVAAIVLAVLPRVKASRVRAKRRKAIRVAARNAAALEAESDVEDESVENIVSARKSASAKSAKTAAPSAPVVAAKPLPVAPAAPIVSAGSPAAAAASALNAALSGGTPEAKKEEVSPEMQDLLSSVFSDEDNSERQAILLKGNEPVAIDELLTLSKAVAAQLRGEQPSNIVRVKENQLT